MTSLRGEVEKRWQNISQCEGYPVEWWFGLISGCLKTFGGWFDPSPSSVTAANPWLPICICQWIFNLIHMTEGWKANKSWKSTSKSVAHCDEELCGRFEVVGSIPTNVRYDCVLGSGVSSRLSQLPLNDITWRWDWNPKTKFPTKVQLCSSAC